MRISTKSRYGLRALFDMAYTAGTLPVQIKDISRRQQISHRYLEQIFHSLIKAGSNAHADTAAVNCVTFMRNIDYLFIKTLNIMPA